MQYLQPNVQKLFFDLASDLDKELLADYIILCTKQEKITVITKRVYIIALCHLSRYLKHEKSFEDMSS